MKTLFTFLLFFLLLSVTIFPQNRISETNNRNIKELKSTFIKSERSNWKDISREKQFYENNMDEKTIINKKLLENGSLLIEAIYQRWKGSAWVNDSKDLYTYDENNNLTEELHQSWDGSAWMNGSKYSYTYDANNNEIELIRQIWKGSAWVNNSKSAYSYDENNNRTEELRQIWDGSALVNIWKISSTYDENNNLIE